MTQPDVKNDIGDRFKAYEQCYDFTLPRRLASTAKRSRKESQNEH